MLNGEVAAFSGVVAACAWASDSITSHAESFGQADRPRRGPDVASWFCRGFAGHLLLFDPVQAPPLWHAFESMNAAIHKADSRLRH